MDLLQVLALVCFLCAAVLAAVAYRTSLRGDLWATLMAVGLALWLISTTRHGQSV